MPKACCVDGCIAKDVIYFRFPNSRMCCKKWMEAVKLSTKPNHNSVLCSAHFSSEDYSLVRGKFRLKAKVVPSLHQPEPHKPNQTIQNSPIDTKTDKTDKLQDTTENRIENISPNNNCNDTQSEPHTPNQTIQNSTTDTKTDKTDKTDKQQDTTEKNRIENISPNNNCNDTVPNGKYPVSNNEKNGSMTTEKLKIGKQSRRKKTVKGLSIGRKRKGEEKQTESISQAIKPLADLEVSEKQDIEEMLTYYHIKQNRDVAERQNAEFEREKMRQTGKGNGDDRSKAAEFIEIDLPSYPTEADPVFIEIAVDQDNPNERGSGSPRDCLMVMESVQVELDPNDLMLPDLEDAEEPETIVIDDKPDDPQGDPISLLTSSDEDEVIYQEPRIDTVVVSDESDSDDRPLVQMATALLVCSLCDYSTASKTQLGKHRKKHRVERRYNREKQRTNIMYHLRSHVDSELDCGK